MNRRFFLPVEKHDRSIDRRRMPNFGFEALTFETIAHRRSVNESNRREVESALS